MLELKRASDNPIRRLLWDGREVSKTVKPANNRRFKPIRSLLQNERVSKFVKTANNWRFKPITVRSFYLFGYSNASRRDLGDESSLKLLFFFTTIYARNNFFNPFVNPAFLMDTFILSFNPYSWENPGRATESGMYKTY